MRIKSRKHVALVVCVLVLVTSLASIVIAQTIQEEKKSVTQTSTQSQASYQKMVQSEECTQQMAANKYTYQIKNQNKIANMKMTQSKGSGSTGNQESQGSSSGSNGNGNGGGKR